MKLLWVLIAIFSSLCGPARAEIDGPGAGAWDSFTHSGRPRLEWEALKGYRLFFHPSEKDSLRKGLTIAFPVERKVHAAWALVKPLLEDKEFTDPWLRVEGTYEPGRLSIDWDGTYRGRPFKDGPYTFEIHVIWDGPGGEEQVWTVVALKALDFPAFAKVGGVDVGSHTLGFQKGDYVPLTTSATFSKSKLDSLPILAKVMAPELPEPFRSGGLLIMGKRIADSQGKPVDDFYRCLCQQPLPPDSPARLAPKKVRCDWDLHQDEAGLWDLRLGLYHEMKHPDRFGACDAPLLDQDRLRILITE